MLVSILIPCYNASQHIRQCLESVLNQTYQDIEIILLDDGSTDLSFEIAKTFPIQVFKQENQGQAYTRNKLFELSNGDYIQYLDADDYLLPYKIEEQVRILNDNIDVVVDKFNVLNNDNQIYTHGCRDTILTTLAIGCKFQSNCFLFKRKVLEQIKWRKLPCQDSLMCLDIFKSNFTMKVTNNYSSVYRRDWSDDQITKQRIEERQRINQNIINISKQLLQVERYKIKDEETSVDSLFTSKNIFNATPL